MPITEARRQEIRDRLDARIDELEQRLKSMRSLRVALEDDVLVSEVARLFVRDLGLVSAAASPARQPSGKIITALREYFDGRDNKWATISEIVDGTNMSKHSLRQAVYRTHADEFERREPEGKRRQTLFRFRPRVGESNEQPDG